MEIQADLIKVGQIAGVYGVKGWCKIQSFTRPAENILQYSPWFLTDGNSTIECALESTRRHGKGYIAKLLNIDDRDAALALLKKDIMIKRQQLPTLSENEYYWRDLEGLTVQTVAGKVLGTVDYLFETKAHDVLAVKGADQSLLIPFVLGDTVQAVDLAQAIITVDWKQT